MRAMLPAILALLIAQPALAEQSREPSAAEAPAAARKSPAEMRADALDSLFARLHRVRAGEEAKLAEQAIWKLWKSSDSPAAEVLIGQAERAMDGRAFDASLGILDRLVEVHPDFAEAWNKRATLYFMMGRFKDSLADIDAVLNLEPRHFGALAGRGMIYQKEKNISGALDAFRDALAINPNMPSVKDAVKQLERLEQPI